MKKGDLFWSIAPDSESQGYGDEKPRKPWRGMIMEDPGRGSVKISYVSEETGLPDDDSNATAYVIPEYLYLTGEDATMAYKKMCKVYLRYMFVDLLKFMAEIGYHDLKLEQDIEWHIDEL